MRLHFLRLSGYQVRGFFSLPACVPPWRDRSCQGKKRSGVCRAVSPILIIGLFGLGLFLPLFAAGPQVTAIIDSPEITVGESAQLTISVEGSNKVGEPVLPDVDGLAFSGGGRFTSTNFQIINGKMSGGTTHTFTFAVIPTKTGSFTIPPIEVMMDGKKFKTNPVLLRVVKSASGLSPSPPQPLPSPSRSSPTPSTGSGNTTVPSSEVTFIQLVYPNRDFYVGELVPMDLKVYLHRRLSIQGVSMPTLSGDAFTVGKLSNKPSQTQEVVEGNPYLVLTWHTTIAAVKAGDHPFGAQIQATLLVRNKGRRHSSIFDDDGFIDDSFFDSFFGRGQEKQVNLRTKETTVRILSLPTEGRPVDFSGAVGHFELSSSASPTHVNVGDPITLKATVSGSGNFDRVNAPLIESADGWKTYNPNARFESADEVGFEGTKTFEQAIVPQRADLPQVPAIRFSYFDPESRKYVTLTSPPVAIQVTAGTQTPAGGTISSGIRPVTVASSPAPPPSTGIPPEELVPNKIELGHLTTGLKPLVLQPWFPGMQLAPLAAVVLAWMIARRRERLASDPSLARALAANRAVRVQIEAMNAALRQQNAGAFFASARRVLQERLGERFGREPQAITLSEVEHLLNDSPLLAEVRRIFEIADSVAYSGQIFSAETLGEWKRTVLEAVKKLEKKK